jgi:hypothetical protein
MKEGQCVNFVQSSVICTIKKNPKKNNERFLYKKKKKNAHNEWKQTLKGLRKESSTLANDYDSIAKDGHVTNKYK